MTKRLFVPNICQIVGKISNLRLLVMTIYIANGLALILLRYFSFIKGSRLKRAPLKYRVIETSISSMFVAKY